MIPERMEVQVYSKIPEKTKVEVRYRIEERGKRSHILVCKS
jgi:hypothetical protein